MKTKRIGVAVMMIFICAATTFGKVTKEFPKHWGVPPEIQTQDYVELPDGYGFGSSTLKHWITANLEKDKAPAGDQPTPAPVLYANNLEKAEIGKVPDDIMVLGGEFVVKSDGTNQFLELPGAPLETFGAQFGPAEKENVVVSARVFGTGKGRRAPSFGVGLGGVSGWKLQASPGKKTIELLKDQDIKSGVPLDWKSGEWMHLKLQIRKIKDGEWKIEGKAWQGDGEPKDWMISFDEKEDPVAGKSSILGSPFAGTPIWFDDFVVERVK